MYGERKNHTHTKDVGKRMEKAYPAPPKIEKQQHNQTVSPTAWGC